MRRTDNSLELAAKSKSSTRSSQTILDVLIMLSVEAPEYFCCCAAEAEKLIARGRSGDEEEGHCDIPPGAVITDDNFVHEILS